MPRVKRGVTARARHKKVLKQAKGFRGREMAHREFGERLLERVRKDLDAVGLVEQFPKLEGRQMVMVLAPKKKAPATRTKKETPPPAKQAEKEPAKPVTL